VRTQGDPQARRRPTTGDRLRPAGVVCSAGLKPGAWPHLEKFRAGHQRAEQDAVEQHRAIRTGEGPALALVVVAGLVDRGPVAQPGCGVDDLARQLGEVGNVDLGDHERRQEVTCV
jgi:hypothetical protein